MWIINILDSFYALAGAFLPFELAAFMLLLIPLRKWRTAMAYWSLLSIGIIIFSFYLPYYFDSCVWIIDFPIIEGTIYLYSYPFIAIIWVACIVTFIVTGEYSKMKMINIFIKIASIIFCLHFIYIIHYHPIDFKSQT